MITKVGHIYWLTGALLMAVLTTSCDRRELYVYGEEFHSLTLNVDWHDYQSKEPDGMTAWFWPREAENPLVPDSLAAWGKPYRFTTASVLHCNLYLQSGRYHGVVVDYSPEEYSRLQFVAMDSWRKARVMLVRDAYQPSEADKDEELYGPKAYARELSQLDATGHYMVMTQAEPMALDTLCGMQISTGEYGDYIPYDSREQYQQTLTVKGFAAKPKSLVWEMRLRIPVKGINNIWQVDATLAGLADGHYLARHCNTETPCMVHITDWNIVKTDNDGNGYVEATVYTFGRCGAGDDATRAEYEHENLAEDFRLNLKFTLRDHKTTCLYHMDVGTHITDFLDEQVLRMWLKETDFGADSDLGTSLINLPYVTPYDGAGFGADVTPWEIGQDAEITF